MDVLAFGRPYMVHGGRLDQDCTVWLSTVEPLQVAMWCIAYSNSMKSTSDTRFQNPRQRSHFAISVVTKRAATTCSLANDVVRRSCALPLGARARLSCRGSSTLYLKVRCHNSFQRHKKTHVTWQCPSIAAWAFCCYILVVADGLLRTYR